MSACLSIPEEPYTKLLSSLSPQAHRSLSLIVQRGIRENSLTLVKSKSPAILRASLIDWNFGPLQHFLDAIPEAQRLSTFHEVEVLLHLEDPHIDIFHGYTGTVFNEWFRSYDSWEQDRQTGEVIKPSQSWSPLPFQFGQPPPSVPQSVRYTINVNWKYFSIDDVSRLIEKLERWFEFSCVQVTVPRPQIRMAKPKIISQLREELKRQQLTGVDGRSTAGARNTLVLSISMQRDASAMEID